MLRSSLFCTFSVEKIKWIVSVVWPKLPNEFLKETCIDPLASTGTLRIQNYYDIHLVLG